MTISDDTLKAKGATDAKSHLRDVNRSMAKGAVWTIAMRFAIRGIGLVSTIILARLLVPADFGLVAIASMIFALVDVMSQFGFQVVLIQKQDAGRDYYDTAWTMSILRGAVTASVLGIFADPLAQFFNDSRLVEIVHVLALTSFVMGFANIGIVDFRKQLNFSKDFNYEVAVKVVAFCVTITGAFMLRNYWALVIGMASGTIARVVLSYAMHPFRPRLSLTRWREIMNFSKWLLLNNILNFARHRSDTMIIGKVMDAASLGLYTVAHEIATLATTELIAPIRRALMPGYSKLSDDPAALRRSFIDGMALIIMIGAPAAIGIGLTADPLVRLFLGDKWLEAIPLLQVLAIYGFIQITFSNTGPLIYAIGKPKLITIASAISVTITVPLVLFMTLQWGVIGAAWALAISGVFSACMSFYIASRSVGVSMAEYISATWRTVISLGVMAGAIVWSATPLEAMHVGAILLLEVLIGIFSYTGAHLLAWHLCGRPAGPERSILGIVFKRKNGIHANPAI